MNNTKQFIQAVWGIALIMMGLAVFFRIPHLMEEISNIKQYASAQIFIRFCLYLMAVLLVGGGVKKLYAFLRIKKNDNTA